MFLHMPARVTADRLAPEEKPVGEWVLQEGVTRVPGLVRGLGLRVRLVVAKGDSGVLTGVFAVGRAFGHHELEAISAVFSEGNPQLMPEVPVGATNLSAGREAVATAALNDIAGVCINQDVVGRGVAG
jgi:hypothetical protein